MIMFLFNILQLIVLELGDDNDLIILNPSWLLTDIVGNLFAMETIWQARITGSFTYDDLQFLVAVTEKIDIVVKVLIALECCTACLVKPEDELDEAFASSQARKESIQSFYEDALAATRAQQYPQSFAQELQLEIPRLNLVHSNEEEWGCFLSGEDIRRTGVQFREAGLQLIHVFP